MTLPTGLMWAKLGRYRHDQSDHISVFHCYGISNKYHTFCIEKTGYGIDICIIYNTYSTSQSTIWENILRARKIFSRAKGE